MRAPALLLLLAVMGGTTACLAVVETTPPTSRPARAQARPGVAVAFHEGLSPYGTWLQTTTYGWAWSPDRGIVGADFMPYVSGGSWLLTDVGWMWMSTWDWGWAPFHYGRWYWDARHGWLWVPDTLWAPAWVDWRWGHDYVGWAPLPPRRPHVEVHDHSSYWVFARAGDLTAPSISPVLVPAHEAHGAAVVTKPLRVEVTHDGRSWYAGPPAPEDVEPLKIKPPHTGEILWAPLNVRPTAPAAPPRPRALPPLGRVKAPARAIPGKVRVPSTPSMRRTPRR